jgi:hypothetical protein
VAVATPMPGTDFYRYCKDHGSILIDDLGESLDESGFQKCVISYPHMNFEEITFYVDKALRKYYLNFTYVPIVVKNVFGKNGFHELKSLVTSANMYFKYLRRGNDRE